MIILVNYQKELDKTIENIVKSERIPSLLLHSCCAPCSSYVLEYLSAYFRITVFYWNPNIYPEKEYIKRVEEQSRLLNSMPLNNPVDLKVGEYRPEIFYECVKGYENEPEAGERCFRCYRLRLQETARLAGECGYDYFTTTLTVSPYKNAMKLNEIGSDLASRMQVPYLLSDFKKKNGYLRSIELSRQYGLYRQDYCGCVYSMRERAKENKVSVENT